MGLVSGGREPLEVEAVVDPAEGSFRPGERVELECPPGDVLRLSAWAYGLPLLLALFGSLGGLRFGDAGTAIGALAGLAAGFLLARRHFRAAGRQLMPEARRS